MSLQVKYWRKGSNTERYVCSKRDIKSLLSSFETLEVHFGLTKHFEFDSRCPKRPKIKGLVVASASINREKEIALYLYVIPRSSYSDSAASLFSETVLADIDSWFTEQLDKSDTAILGYEQLVIEWTGEEHKKHFLRYL